MAKRTRRLELPLQTRLAPIDSVNAEARTAEVIWSTGERVKRYDWQRDQEYWEELSLDPAHVRMGRLQSQSAPVLNAHNRWSLSDQIGVVDGAALEARRGIATLRFSARDDVEPIFRDVRDKIVRNVSAGYRTYKIERMPPDATSDGLPIYRAIDWEPVEISLVPIGADAGAGIRAEPQQRTYPCEVLEHPPETANQRTEASMNDEERRAADAEAARNREATERAQREEQERSRITAEATRAERARQTLIADLCTRHTLPEAVRTELSGGELTAEQIRVRVLDELAARTEAAPVRSASAGDLHVVGDERLTRREMIGAALLHRVAPAAALPEGARQYRYMSLLRLAEEVLTAEGVRVRGLSPMELATRSLMSTSDFANILADVANKRLRMAYEENVPTYTRWARRAPNAPDFKNINVAQISGAPSLQKVVEGGEFTYGSMSDGKEVYAVLTYGRIISLTRQAIVNDDLNAFDRVPRAFSGAARRLENYTVYQQLVSNPNMADNIAVFHTSSHGANLAGSGAVISDTTLNAGRAVMRAQVGLQSEKLNVAPRFLLAGVTSEQKAYQYTSAQFVPSQASAVNEFRAGGRTALEPIIDPEVTTTSWYLVADNAQVDTVEFCYLDGSEGVYLESQLGFKIDGVDLKARLDFAAKVIDYRGLYKNPGA